MPATLRLTREGFGIELRRGRFDVLVDGQNMGSLNFHDTIEEAVPPGQHALQLQAGRYSSRNAPFDAADGETVSFRCHGAMVWPRWLVSFARPDLAISLRRE
jgi:hypothetical protein